MSFKLISTILSADVPPNGTFTLGYPAGTNAGTFIGGVGHMLRANQADFTCPVDFGVAFGATLITVTNRRAGVTLRAGSKVTFQGSIAGANPVADQGYVQPGPDVTVPSVTSVRELLVNLGAPVAANATLLRAAAAVGAGGALVLAVTAFDVPRNVVITSAGNDAGRTFTVTSKDPGGKTLTETITGANAGAAAGVKAHYGSITVSVDAACAGNVSVGSGNALGLPVYLPSAAFVIKEIMNKAAAVAGTFVAGLDSNTASTSATADVRGTYVPNTAPNGTNAYQLILALPDPSYLGPPQA